MSKFCSIGDVVRAAGAMRKVHRESRCPCGCKGTWNKAVRGTIGGSPALWMGCRFRNGSSVGGGLTGPAYHVAYAVLDACSRSDIDIDIDDVMQSTWDDGRHGVYGTVSGPLGLQYEREQLAAVVAAWEAAPARRSSLVDPASYASARRVHERDIDIDDVCDGILETAAV